MSLRNNPLARVYDAVENPYKKEKDSNAEWYLVGLVERPCSFNLVHPQKTEMKGSGNTASVLKHLPRLQKAMSSISGFTKTKPKQNIKLK